MATLSHWLGDIHLSDQATLRRKRRIQRLLERSRSAALEKRSQTRELRKIELQQKYRPLLKRVNESDVSLLLLGVLYLAEGTKGHRRSGPTFGNSDARIIRLYLHLLRSIFQVDEKKFRCTVQGRADQNMLKLQRYWSKITGIPKSQFYTPRIDPRTRGVKSNSPKYRGVCRIDYLSASTFYEIIELGNVITDAGQF